MKLVVSSDNHLDINKVDVSDTLIKQANYLNHIQADYYLFAGDMFNDFAKTKNYLEALNKQISGQVFFVAGNHDMLKNITFTQLETHPSPLYLHNQYYDFPRSNWRLIANNGWYDYSFAPNLTTDEISRWKKAYWVDSTINQPFSDLDRMQLVLSQVDQQLKLAQTANKQVIFLTHFVPHQSLLWPRPATFSKPRYERVFEMVNALLGSQNLGKLLASYPNVDYVFYGHVHGKHPNLTTNTLTYLHQAVGIKRRHEWVKDSFIQQWLTSLQIVDI